MDAFDALNTLRKDAYIREKNLGNDISSFNFTSKAFFDGVWSNETIKSRGLFLNNKTGDVVARSYNKFFNIGERPETEMKNLKDTLQFPVKAYKKYNGYLLIVSSYDGLDLMVCSKSTNQGQFAENGRDILMKSLAGCLNGKSYVNLVNYLYENKVSMVFECIDPINNPHIVEYNNSHLVLLDIVYNDINYNHYPSVYLGMILHTHLGIDTIEVKHCAAVLNNFDEFKEFLEFHKNDENLEGYVFEDGERTMVKYKTDWYRAWKVMRGVVQQLWNGKNLDDIKNIRNKLALVPLEFERFLRDSVIPNFHNGVYDSCPSIIFVRNAFELWSENIA